MKRLIIASIAACVLSGCAPHARHSQCQSLASKSEGASWGAAIAGTYVSQMQANIAERQYERCETTFDAIDYAKGTPSQGTSQTSAQDSVSYGKATVYLDLKGNYVATENGMILMLNNENYQFTKSTPNMMLNKDDPDTGAKQGDQVSAKAFVNGDHSKGAFIALDTTQTRYWVSTFNIVNGKPDKASSHDTEVKIKG